MKYFLITTIHNKETRWSYIKNHLSDIGIEYTPILAPDWEMFKHTELNPAQYKQQSLTLAYYQIAQTAVFEGVTDYVVLEDDVFISKPEKLKQILESEITPLADLIYLTKTVHNQRSAKTTPLNTESTFANLLEKVESNWWETPITWWSHRFAKSFIRHIAIKRLNSIWLGHIDHELLKMLETGKYKFYGATVQTAIGLSNNSEAENIPNFSTEGSINHDVLSSGVGG